MKILLISLLLLTSCSMFNSRQDNVIDCMAKFVKMGVPSLNAEKMCQDVYRIAKTEKK
jgi:hypothetical protein